MTRSNPAVHFMAKTLAENATGKPWRRVSQKKRLMWMERAAHLLTEMYLAGFRIPMPVDPGAVWKGLES